MKSTNKKETKKQKLADAPYWIAITVLLIAVTLVLGFIAMNQSKSIEQNSFTAIYFGDYNKDSSNATANFSFTIENHENKKNQYTIDINFDSTTIKTIELTLEKNQKHSETISLPFTLDQRSSHKISVNLRNRKEGIHYWTNTKKEYPAIFGEKNIAILGYSISPEKPLAGKDFNISYNWKCLFPTETSQIVFVHFVDAQGKTAFQNDHLPRITDANNNQKEYPTSKCVPNTLFSETYKLKAQKAGDYTIRIGLYTKENGRLEVDNDNPEKYFALGSFKAE